MLRSATAALVTAAFGIGGIQSGLAADLPVKARQPAPVAAAPYNWTGWYLGVNVGYGVGRHPTTWSAVSGAGYPILGAGVPLYGGPQDVMLSPEGWLGGGQIGFNVHMTPSWVVGIEADIQFSDMKDSANCLLPCGVSIIPAGAGVLAGFPVQFSEGSIEQKINWFGTVRGRLGYAHGPALFFFTGGLAYGEAERRGSATGSTVVGAAPGIVVNSFAGSYSKKSVEIGWTLGGGIEAQLLGGWTAKAEYLYMDLGSVTDSFDAPYTFSAGGAFGTVGTNSGSRTDTADLRQHIFRVGLNYRFGAHQVAARW